MAFGTESTDPGFCRMTSRFPEKWLQGQLIHAAVSRRSVQQINSWKTFLGSTNWKKLKSSSSNKNPHGQEVGRRQLQVWQDVNVIVESKYCLVIFVLPCSLQIQGFQELSAQLLTVCAGASSTDIFKLKRIFHRHHVKAAKKNSFCITSRLGIFYFNQNIKFSFLFLL